MLNFDGYLEVRYANISNVCLNFLIKTLIE